MLLPIIEGYTPQVISGGRMGFFQKIQFYYYPEPGDLSTMIVFIQVMRYVRNGVPALPIQADLEKSWKIWDATSRLFVVDHRQGEIDPYYNGNDPQDIGIQGNAVARRAASMFDRPTYDFLSPHVWPTATTHVRKEFRTAVFSAAGADAGKYYRYQDWSYEEATDQAPRLALGWAGEDPGQDFKDAVNWWCHNHRFTLPTPPPPPPPPAAPVPLRGMTRYTVVSGDTLQKLALKFYGNEVYWTLILNENGGVLAGSNPLLLLPGQTLVIP